MNATAPIPVQPFLAPQIGGTTVNSELIYRDIIVPGSGEIAIPAACFERTVTETYLGHGHLPTAANIQGIKELAAPAGNNRSASFQLPTDFQYCIGMHQPQGSPRGYPVYFSKGKAPVARDDGNAPHAPVLICPLRYFFFYAKLATEEAGLDGRTPIMTLSPSQNRSVSSAAYKVVFNEAWCQENNCTFLAMLHPVAYGGTVAQMRWSLYMYLVRCTYENNKPKISMMRLPIPNVYGDCRICVGTTAENTAANNLAANIWGPSNVLEFYLKTLMEGGTNDDLNGDGNAITRHLISFPPNQRLAKTGDLVPQAVVPNSWSALQSRVPAVNEPLAEWFIQFANKYPAMVQ